jgi:hypothetical protein
MDESSKVPSEFESIIVIPRRVMNFQSRKMRRNIYTYAITPNIFTKDYRMVFILTKMDYEGSKRKKKNVYCRFARFKTFLS